MCPTLSPQPGPLLQGPRGGRAPHIFQIGLLRAELGASSLVGEPDTIASLFAVELASRTHAEKPQRPCGAFCAPRPPPPSRPRQRRSRSAGAATRKATGDEVLLVRPQALFSPTPPSGTPPYTCFRTSRAPPPGLRQFLRVPLFWTTSTVLRSGVLPGAGTPGLSVWGHGRTGALACGRQLAEMGVLSVTHAEGKRRLSRGSAPPPRPRSPGRGRLSGLPTAATSLHPCCPLQASRRQSPHPRGLSLPPLLGILLLGRTVSSPHYLFCFYLHRCLWATVQCRGAYSAASAAGSTFRAAPASPGRAPPSGVRHFLAAWRRPAGFCFRRLFACASSKNNHPFLWRTLSFPL